MRVAGATIGILLGLGTMASARPSCDPASEPDRSDVAAARAAVAAACDCGTAASRRDYVRCALAEADAVLANRGCRRLLKRCAKRSVCGRPGFVTCCRTGRDGAPRCKPMRDAARCDARGGAVGTCSSCCDACPPPGEGPSCPVVTTTSTTTTTTTTTTADEQCCFRSTTCGPLDTCQVTATAAECQSLGGAPFGAGSCSPSPCFSPTTTTPPAACCFGDGQCEMTGFCECGAYHGGVFQFFQICRPGLCTTTTTMP